MQRTPAETVEAAAVTPDETLVPDPRRPRRVKLRDVPWLPYYAACWLLNRAVRFVLWLATDGTL